MEACVQVVWAKEQEPRMGKEGKPLCYRGGHHLYSVRCDLLWRSMKCIWELFKWEDRRGRSIYVYIPRLCWTRAVLGCQLLHIARWHRCESATPLACPLLWYQRSLGVESKKQAAQIAHAQMHWSETGMSLHWLGQLSSGWCELWGQRMLNWCPRGHWPLLIFVTPGGLRRLYGPCKGYILILGDC